MPVKLDGGPQKSEVLSKSKTAVGGGTHASTVSVKAGRSVVFPSPSGGPETSAGLSKSKTAVGGGTHASTVSVKAGRSVVFTSPSENLKSRKKPEEPIKRGKSPGFQLEACLASLRVRNIVILSTVLLVLGALLMFTLYKIQLDEYGKLLQSVHVIRKFMVDSNHSFEILSDPQILEEAKRLADELYRWNNLNDNLESKIHIQKKKKEGWEMFKGHLYFFASAKAILTDARKDCESYKSMLVFITSSEEQLFVERQTLRKGTPHWIGLSQVGNEWLWETGAKVQPPIKNSVLRAFHILHTKKL